jgi:hypothetical protein
MKIGSNNSLTYLEPSSWWLKILNKITRHQRKDYQFQYFYCRVRYFDIRVSADMKGHIVLNNGCNLPMYEVLEFLERYGDVTVCITLDESLDKYNYGASNSLENKFKNTCKVAETIYKGINFVGGYRIYDKKQIYKFKGEELNVIDLDKESLFYSIVSRLFPFMRKKLNNKYIDKFKYNDGILLLNYVDYKA